MVDPTGIERVAERTHDVLLAGEFGEAAWPPFTGKDEITHALAPGCGAAARASTPPAPNSTATAAPFRASRGLRLIVAEKPTRTAIERGGRREPTERRTA